MLNHVYLDYYGLSCPKLIQSRPCENVLQLAFLPLIGGAFDLDSATPFMQFQLNRGRPDLRRKSVVECMPVRVRECVSVCVRESKSNISEILVSFVVRMARGHLSRVANIV